MSEIENEIRRQMLAERAERPAAGVANPAAVTQSPASPADTPNAPGPTALERMKSRGGLGGAIASLLLLLFKIKGALAALKLLSFSKVLLTGGSMLLSMWLEALYFGWPFAVGLVLLIFLHECGHAWAGRLRGIPMSGMVFIPFMGAAVALKRGGRNVTEDAFIGIMGPVFGTLGGVLCVGIYLATRSPFWLYLAQFNFFLNLFNLAPMAPLDGGWIVPVFSPRLLALGVVLLFLLAPRNPLIWVLALMSLPRIVGGWKARPESQSYYQATASDRWKYGFAYLGLAAFLAVGYLGLRDYLGQSHPVPQRSPGNIRRVV